ncbi:unnamed protein product [Orchesella dallaii]|uniref:Glutamate decarboxylase n=1 Tax=Orchesella dallaii TaxID=48710 RepID=A0ABP1R7X8_9HEXA
MSEEQGPPPEVSPEPPTLPKFTSVSWPPFHFDLYERVYKLIQEKGLYFNSEIARQQPPYLFKTPEELRQEINFTLDENPVDQDTLFDYFEKIIKYSPHRSHPFYLGRDGTGLDPYAIAGDFTSNVLSTAVLTYLFAPVFTLQENVVEMNLRRLIGYPNPEKGDGVVTPGGGFATSMVFAAALNYKFPDIRNQGYGATDVPVLAVYASEACNEFLEKGCIVAGLGVNSLFKIRTDQNGRMDLNHLRQQMRRNKSRGTEPLMVIATIGTDPMGAVDDTAQIAQICEENNAWFHVDGTYGGPFLLSDEYRASKLAGVEKSQSFIIGGGGMLGTPYCFTVMVTPYEDQFFNTFGVGAEVVFEPTLLYDSSYDNGDHTLQTSRRGDISKFWLMWKVKGRNGISQHLEYIMNLAAAFNEEIKRRPNFHAIMTQLDSTRVTFYYVPNQFRLFPRRTDYLNYQMSNLSRRIKNKLLQDGSAVLGLAKVRGYPESFAVSISNSATTLDDLKYVLDEIEAVGNNTIGRMSNNPWFPIVPFKKDAADLKKEDVDQESPPPATVYATPPPPRDTYPSYVNAPIESLHQEMFLRIAGLFDEKGVYFQDKRSDPLLRFRAPDDLMQEFDLNLRDESSLQSNDDIIEALENMIRYSIHQAHPYYIYQLLSGGLDAYTIMSDFISTVMTTNSLTYEDAPIYTIMEEEVLRASRRRLGYPEDGDGMMMPGGSICNIVAVTVARLAKFPDTKDRGLDGWREVKPTLFISQNAHYCLIKAGLLNGIGQDNVVLVRADPDGRMDINELRDAIAKSKEEGRTPFFVGATGGTTVLGVFDNLGEISQICQENNMWMHIDASVGGAAMFSDTKLAELWPNGKLSDSMSFNPHKWFGSSQETTVLMFKQKGIVKQTLGVSSSNTRTWPNGDSTKYDSNKAFGDLAAHGGIGWERRPNVLKLWMLWKAKGRVGMGNHIDYTYANKGFLVQELKKPERQEMFRLVKPDFTCAGVCFYYLPLTLRGMDENSADYKLRVEKVALPLQARLVRAGVTITPVFRDSGSPLFTKFTILSSGITTDDILYLLDAIDYYGRNINA